MTSFRADAEALLVGLEEGAAGDITAALATRGIAAHRVTPPAAVGAFLDAHPITIVFASAADRTEFGVLTGQCVDIPVVAVLTGESDVASADALRAGVASLLVTPFAATEVLFAFDRALAGSALPPDSEDTPPPAPPREGLLGESEPMKRVAELIARAAPSMATALVRGETGTGKELVARALHRESPRRSGPFIALHCGALPEALLESELFGYEKGAFTGATTRKPGRVELAEGGTLFLDEIGDVSVGTQVKLLRILQERKYERLGGVATLSADVRFVAATHRDLEGMVKKGEFREDLFYRLNVVTIWLPPLRARRDDVPILAEAFCADFAKTHGKPNARLDAGALAALRSERWPGNVRQLQNFVERLVVLGATPTITAEDVRREMGEHVQFKTQITGAAAPRLPDLPAGSLTGDASPPSRALPLDQAVRDAEAVAIQRALRHAGGNRTTAARILGVSRATLYTKLAEHGIS